VLRSSSLLLEEEEEEGGTTAATTTETSTSTITTERKGVMAPKTLGSDAVTTDGVTTAMSGKKIKKSSRNNQRVGERANAAKSSASVFPTVKVFRLNCNRCGTLVSSNFARIHQHRVFDPPCCLNLIRTVSQPPLSVPHPIL
jgi:hypothetical protein